MTINIENLNKDIDYETARRAFYFISFNPERQADRYIQTYVEVLQDLALYIHEQAKDEKQEAISQDVFEKLRALYKKAFLAMLSAKSRCASSAVVGGGNFNVTRAHKRNNIAHKREDEVYALEANMKKYALKMLNKVYTPQEKQSDELETMKRKLEASKKHQENMKAINKAHKAYVKNPEGKNTLALLEGLSDAGEEIVKTYVPQYSWEPHPFAPYQLTNNLANIKRMEERVKVLEAKHTAAQEVGEVKKEYNGLEVVKNYTEDRLQLIFDGKPDADVRSLLKSNGFRWSPKNTAWQRKLTNNATYALTHYVMKQEIMTPFINQ